MSALRPLQWPLLELVSCGARQRDRRQQIALRQNEHRLRQQHRAERAEQSERVGAGQRNPGQPQNAPAKRRKLHLHLHFLARRHRRNQGVLRQRHLEWVE